MTHREYLARLAWIREQWNNPSRSDYYLMQIASFIYGPGADKRYKAPGEFKVPFEDPVRKRKKGIVQTARSAVEFAKSVWAARLGPARRK